jgi:hypothetical protein
MNDSHRMVETDVVEILGWLSAASVDVWLDGGWGVDALVGEQTREHNDLDLIVRDHEPGCGKLWRPTVSYRSAESRSTSYWLTNEDARWKFTRSG